MRRCTTIPTSKSTTDLVAALSHVRWIGGGSGAGKSTIARRLADASGAMHYDIDETMGDHAARCPPERCPKLAAFKRMSMDERWVRRTPRAILESFHWFAGEGFDLVVHDLLAMPHNAQVIAEGFRLLPRFVVPLLEDPRRALWLLPTPAFRHQAFDARGTTWDIPRRTSDPERALANLMARDAMFTDRLRKEAGELGLRTPAVDGSMTENELLDIVEDRIFS